MPDFQSENPPSIIQRPIVVSILENLNSKGPEKRNAASRQLSDFIATELREASAAERQRFEDELSTKISNWHLSSDVNDKKAAVLAMTSLIDMDGMKHHPRFVSYLRSKALSTSDIELASLVATVIGKMALSHGNYTADYVDFEVNRAFESLAIQERSESKKQTAVLVLRELAICTPTLFFQHVQNFFDLMLTMFKQTKMSLSLRENAAKALSAALVVTSQRERKESKWIDCLVLFFLFNRYLGMTSFSWDTSRDWQLDTSFVVLVKGAIADVNRSILTEKRRKCELHSPQASNK